MSIIRYSLNELDQMIQHALVTCSRVVLSRSLNSSIVLFFAVDLRTVFSPSGRLVQ